jgi:hypothetical protein
LEPKKCRFNHAESTVKKTLDSAVLMRSVGSFELLGVVEALYRLAMDEIDASNLS